MISAKEAYDIYSEYVDPLAEQLSTHLINNMDYLITKASHNLNVLALDLATSWGIL